MPFVVANEFDAASPDLSEPDAGDYLALGNRSTGIVSGGAITASGSPSMTIQVAQVECIIAGVPYTFAATTAVLGSSTAQARYDLIGWTSAGRTVIPGAPSGNPVFPAFDPNVFCLGAAVYVGANVGSITAPNVQAKGVTLEPSFRRKYTSDDAVALEAFTNGTPTSFKVLANGTISWVDSVLRRTAAKAMELATSFTIKQATANLAGLIVKAAANATANPFEVQNDVGTVLAFIDPDGNLVSQNIRAGTVAPTAVSAPRGTIYINVDSADGNAAVYYKTSSTGADGWVAYKVYNPTEQLIPTGVILPWLGSTADILPAGYVLGDGEPVLITTETTALSNLVGSRFGSAPAGYFRASPDLRGQVLLGAGHVLALDSGVQIGAESTVLTATQMPVHEHELVDPGHTHPRLGPAWYRKHAAYSENLHPDFDPSSGLDILAVEGDDFNRSAQTGITLGAAGGTDPVSLYQPSTSALYIIKL